MVLEHKVKRWQTSECRWYSKYEYENPGKRSGSICRSTSLKRHNNLEATRTMCGSPTESSNHDRKLQKRARLCVRMEAIYRSPK